MRSERREEGAALKLSSRRVSGSCLCGAVELEIDFPAFWAWHDHSAASRHAHGAAYATYIGCWRKHARVAKGQRSIAPGCGGAGRAPQKDQLIRSPVTSRSNCAQDSRE